VRIVVLVKYVPQVDSDLRFNDSFQVVREAASGTLNELDEHAVEAALTLAYGGSSAAGSKTGSKNGAAATAVSAAPDAASSPDAKQASGGAGEVIALTMAPEIGDLALRKTFQLGVGRGIRLTDNAFANSDVFGTVAALAAAIRKLGEEQPVDLVITGMASSDAGGAVLPAVLANELGWPILSFADSVSLTDGALTIKRNIDNVHETLRAPLPAVLSVTDAANTVRPPNFKLLKEARTKPIETWGLADLDVDPANVGAAGSRVVVANTARVPEKPAPPKVFDDGAGSGAKALVDFIKQIVPAVE